VTAEPRVIGPLRASREPLHAGLRTLQVAAESIESAEPRVALAAMDAALQYVRNVLVLTCQAEEYTLFPAVDGVYGATGTCQVMVAQHAAIAAMAADLEQVVEAARSGGEPGDYRRYLVPLLHGLYAVARAHLEAEDDAYLSLLDAHLSESQVGVIVDNIGRITAARLAE
jgi:hemerythrin-like domain-containing protein